MEVIPVLDLRQGRAVLATGGDRTRYGLLQSVLAPDAGGDPVALGRSLRRRMGSRRCYVADLDSLQGQAPQLELIRRLADPVSGFGPGLLVDAASSSAEAALRLLTSGAGQVVVGLESLRSVEDLEAIVGAAGADRVVFSLDVRDEHPVTTTAKWAEGTTPATLTAMAVESGVSTVLLLDLARVGASAGPALELAEALHAAWPSIALLVGGGIRDVADLQALERVGVTAALVGAALHRGALEGYIESRKVAD